MVEKDPRAVTEAAFDREQMREREVAVSDALRLEEEHHAAVVGIITGCGAQPVAWTVESVRGAALKGGPERAGALAL